MTSSTSLPLVAEILGDGGGGEGRPHAEQSRLVAGGHHDHAFGQPLGPQIALDEFVDFAAAFADQGNHVDVGRRVAGHHAQRHAFADARAGEDSHPLAFAAGQQAVDGANARGHGRVDPRPVQRCRRAGIQRALARAAKAASRPSMHCP